MPRALVLPVLRVLAFGALVVAARGELPIAIPASAGLYFACFALAHDLVHGAFGLERTTNARLLSLVATGMLVSGHAMRLLHLRHHARPLAADDLEGDGARRSVLGALVTGPLSLVTLRIAAFRAANLPGRRRQLVEHAASLLLLVLAAASHVLRVHVAVAVTLQATAPLWASHVPHRAPTWLTAVCARLAFLRSPVLLSLAFHERHHRHPRVPCADLADCATL